MRLEEALPALRQGKKIWRKSYKNMVTAEIEFIFGVTSTSDLNEEDLLADDWEVENERA